MEMLVVMAIIAVLAGVSFSAFRGVLLGAKQKQTNILIENISAAMDQKWSDGVPFTTISGAQSGEFPFPDDPVGGDTSSADLLVALANTYEFENNGGVVYLPDLLQEKNQKYIGLINGKDVILDGFGRPLRYRFDATTGMGRKNNFPGGFDLWSVGPDGIDNKGDGDDITNW